MAKKIIKTVTVVIYIGLIFLAIYHARNMTLDDLLSYTPANKFLAAAFLLGLYSLKSISVFFPIIILQMASGFLFPAPIALFVNLAGTAIGFALPYYLGMFTGADAAERKINQNKNIKRIIDKQRKHEFFLTFFLRVISCLPSDLVSMYLGVLKFNFLHYMAASMLGALPGIIPATFMGRSITDPLSPEFIGSFSITIVCSAASILVYYIYNKKHNKN
ncbi:MAG: TVP38/TMEM64 family protein [Clostridia bacterium]|nr:TVP38/TMEM64 family protein [Clostridia bacterium]